MKKIIFIFLLFISSLFANIGTITLLEGEALVKRSDEIIRLKMADSINKNDLIETKANSKVKITFIDNTIITIGKESSLKIEDYLYDTLNKSLSKTDFNISKGAFHTITGEIGKINPSKFKLKTKNATIGIRGTEIYGDQNRVFCTQGAIYVLSFGETREVANGFFVNTFDNQIPSQSTPIDQQQFQDVNSRLNTNTLGNNPNPNGFENGSSPLQQDGVNPLASSLDSQNSWGYWAGSLQDERNLAKIDEDIIKKTETNTNQSLQLTDATYIQNQIDSAEVQTLIFNGTFSGSNVTDSGHINLNFNIGSGNSNVTGNYNFGYEMNPYSGIFESGSIYEGRDGQMFFDASNYHDTRAEGQFYGPTMNSISGTLNNFDINNQDASVNFSANKQ